MQQEPAKKNAIRDLVLVFHLFKEAIDSFLQLVKVEAKQARISLSKILSFLLLKILLFMTGWVFSMVSLVFYLASAVKITLALAFLLVGLLNIILVLIVSILIKKHYQKLSFPATRRQLQANLKSFID